MLGIMIVILMYHLVKTPCPCLLLLAPAPAPVLVAFFCRHPSPKRQSKGETKENYKTKEWNKGRHLGDNCHGISFSTPLHTVKCRDTGYRARPNQNCVQHLKISIWKFLYLVFVICCSLYLYILIIVFLVLFSSLKPIFPVRELRGIRFIRFL